MLFGILWLIASAAVLFALSKFGPGTEEIRVEWIRAAGFFLAGVGVAPLGLWLAHQRTMSLSGQTENESARRITDAFTKAVELLGHDRIAVRQGGIYALGRLASEPKSGHPQIMDIIAAYIRNESASHIEREIEKSLKPAKESVNREWSEMQDDMDDPPDWMLDWAEKREKTKEHIVSVLPMPVDLEAAIAVIRERAVDSDRKPTTQGGYIFDLSSAFLYNANFSQASLEKVNLSDCNFRSCLFVRTSLAHANLVGSNFKGSNLFGSNFEGSNLVNSNFEGSNLKGAKFNNANISGADLRKALNLTQAQIDSAKAGASDEDFLLPKGLSPPKKDGGK